MKICIIGGGSLGHVCAAVIGEDPSCKVSLLTGHPQSWGHEISATDPFGKIYRGRIERISDRPEDVVAGNDIVLLCLPGFLIGKALDDIRPYVGSAAVGTIVSSTGFFFMAPGILGENAPIFGFQRVPFISRVSQYGRSANLLGYKDSLAIATKNISDPAGLAASLESVLHTPVRLLGNIFEAALSNSNPILHTGRLYSMLHGRETAVFDHLVMFYKEWDDPSSETILAMDDELSALMKVLGVSGIPSLLEYYESTDAASLTRKISSIPAFQAIAAPMKAVPGGWTADFESRYFTEDFPFGLRYIRELCSKHGVPAPTVEKVYGWGMEQLGG